MVEPEAGMAVDVVSEVLNLDLRLRPAAQVEREHPAGGAAAERGVLEIMIEDDHVAGPAFQGERGYVATGNAECLLGAADLADVGHPAAVGAVAAGQDAQAAGVARDRIEVERHLDVAALRVPAVGVPVGIPGIVVAAPAEIVEVVAEQGCGDVYERRVIQKRAEPLALIYERHDAGAARAVMFRAGMARMDRLELRGDPADLC